MTTQEHTENVWNEFGDGLKSFIFSKVKNDADASDILQDCYLKIHDNIHALNDETRIKAWIYQIARNLIIDYYRNSKRDPKRSRILAESAVSASSGKVMDTAINDMIKMMEELSPELCEALCLTEIEGMSQKEYSEKTGLSYSGAKSRVQRARVMLKDLLLRCCHYHFDRYGTVYDIQPKCCCCCDTKNKK
jgi:RNA polymerase sigma-70 factor (ECF subfamily)